MKSALTVFNFESNEVRFIEGLPVAIDVAKTLGYVDPKSAIRDRVSPKNKFLVDLSKLGGDKSHPGLEDHQITVLKEAGIYQLIFTSKLPSAEKFQDWVFEEVLPSIRKTGSYSTKSSFATEKKMSIKQVMDYAKGCRDLYGAKYAQQVFVVCMDKYYPDVPLLELPFEKTAKEKEQELIEKKVMQFYKKHGHYPRVSEIMQMLSRNQREVVDKAQIAEWLEDLLEK